MIGALPERPVSIRTFVNIAFAERGDPFHLFICTLKVFSFAARADNLKHGGDRGLTNAEKTSTPAY